MSGGRASEASSIFTDAPHRSHYRLSSTSCQHYGELYNYFIIYHNVIIIEIKCTINVMHLNHPETIPPPPVHGKIVFQETGPWCQKGRGPLTQIGLWTPSAQGPRGYRNSSVPAPSSLLYFSVSPLSSLRTRTVSYSSSYPNLFYYSITIYLISFMLSFVALHRQHNIGFASVKLVS